MDAHLDTALQSVKQTLEFLETDSAFDAEEPLVTQNGISLLNLKNQALVSYLHNSALVLLSQIERSTTGEDDQETMSSCRETAVRNTITQRVVLEKGLKGLESKISYQVEKALRSYSKAKAADAARKEKKSNDNDSEDEEEDDEEEETGDLLQFKPNPKLLLGSKGSAAATTITTSQRSKRPDRDMSSDEDDGSDSDSGKRSSAKAEKYQPPKISATTQHGATSGTAKKSQQHRRKNALMEDYLEATSAVPVAEPSIGSTILDHGRGISTARDRRREKEIKDYEETNYTRLSSIQRKEQDKLHGKKKRRGIDNDSFFGEDWGFGSKSNVDSATARGKSGSAWDRAKKRRHR